MGKQTGSVFTQYPRSVSAGASTAAAPPSPPRIESAKWGICDKPLIGQRLPCLSRLSAAICGPMVRNPRALEGGFLALIPTFAAESLLSALCRCCLRVFCGPSTP
ncbi:hypothetical protein VTK26DRAFT_3006 [Humicola hyalothermophila]